MADCTIAIPARIASTRLPRKMLADLCGKPVIQHVIERVKRVRNCQHLCIVTDSEEIVKVSEQLGIKAYLTSPACRSGSERIASILNKLPGDWIFNVQGDEPFVDSQVLESLLDLTKHTQADILTPIFKIKSSEDVFNPNVVKVVLDQKSNALYFSRSPIPFVRDCDHADWLKKYTFWGHIGIYGYRRDVLERYAQLAPSPLESAESLEQLRFLSNQYRIETYQCDYRPVAIDTMADLERARTLMSA